MWMERDASFTGEDSLEISCVGARALVDSIAHTLIECINNAGFPARYAQPGEFAWRAHLAGRLSIDAAESLAARIAATSDAELVAADEVARGVVGQRADALLHECASLLARVEAGIDFTDQDDVITVPAAEVAMQCAEFAQRSDAMRGAHGDAHARATALIVLAGAPNAGKSSLFNALIGQTRCVASPHAGTTRDAIVVRVALGEGIEVDLADLAGVMCASVAPVVNNDNDNDNDNDNASLNADIERSARAMIDSADVIVRCTAPGTTPIALNSTAQIIDVATMSDLDDTIHSTRVAHDDHDHHDHEHATTSLHTSARTGVGITALRRALAARVGHDRAFRRAQLVTILPRYDDALTRAHDHFTQAHTLASTSAARGARLHDIELVASLLRAALDALGEIARPIHPDDVLGLVFSRFCIGK